MNGLTGTSALLTMNLRRDKILLPMCTLSFSLVAAGSAAATAGVYPDVESRSAGGNVINATPALVALYGRVYDPASLGAISVIKLTGTGTLLVALFAAFVVVRHTRADEELGRHELLATGSVGRMAALFAAVLVATIGSLTIGFTTATALALTGLPIAGSVAFGVGWTVAGLAFTGVGAVAAQLTVGARAARGLIIGVLAVAFMLRAVGDTVSSDSPGLLTWLSPIGWVQQIRPYAGDRWPVALLPLVLGLVMASLAALLLAHRDLGAGLLPQRSGRARGGPLLTSLPGLVWRLQRAAIVSWLIVFVALSFVAGQVVSTIDDMLGTPAALQLIVALGGVESVSDAFISVELSFVAVAASAYAISSLLRLSGEEATLRADAVLATPARRVRWVGSHLLITVIASGLLMTVCGLSLGFAHAAQLGDSNLIGQDVTAAVVRLPAIWVMAGVTLLLYGIARRAAPMAWAILVGAFLASELGPLLDLPEWVRNLSPFAHMPLLPGGVLSARALIVSVLVAAILSLAGFITFNRRDVAVS